MPGASYTADTAQDSLIPLDDVVSQTEARVAAQPGGAESPSGAVPYNPEIDKTRKYIAYFLLWILVGIIVTIVLVTIVYSGRCWNEADTCTAVGPALDMLNTSISPVFTAMVGLVGSVVGFYFGSKSQT